MTAAQRRTVTVKIQTGDHIVELTADVADPKEAVDLAERTHWRTRPHSPPRITAGFGPSHAERAHDRSIPGDPTYMPSPVTAQKEPDDRHH